MLWYSCFDRSIWCFWCVKDLHVASIYWNIVWWGCETISINWLLFPICRKPETRSIKRMWRKLTERILQKFRSRLRLVWYFWTICYSILSIGLRSTLIHSFCLYTTYSSYRPLIPAIFQVYTVNLVACIHSYKFSCVCGVIALYRHISWAVSMLRFLNHTDEWNAAEYTLSLLK